MPFQLLLIYYIFGPVNSGSGFVAKPLSIVAAIIIVLSIIFSIF